MALTPRLALDTGSPLVSVAVSRGGETLSVAAAAGERSSGRLLALVARALEESELSLAQLGGVVALAGPGSFTGLRVGLATALGFHQALGIAATAVPTLPVLARAAGRPGELILAAVDALRGDWCAQAFVDGRPRGEARRLAAAELPRLAGGEPGWVVGFGVEALTRSADWPLGLRAVEPGPLAPAAIAVAGEDTGAWDPALLTAPVYSRPPAATPLARPPRR